MNIFTIAAIGLIIVVAIARSYLPRKTLDDLTTIVGSIAAMAGSSAIVGVPGVDTKILAIISGLSLTALAALTNKESKNIYPPR